MRTGILTAIISLTALLSMHPAADAQPAAAVSDALAAKLDEYIAILEKEPVTVKGEEADFLIGSCTDSVIRQFTALRLYNHYYGSKLMGDETVAIHIFDNWFSDGKVKMKTEADFMNARIFAEFNRQSLIGKKAPELCLEDTSGTPVSLFTDGYRESCPAVLFFYDSGCPTCKMESIMMRSLLDGMEYPVDLYSVYTGQSEENMGRFIGEYLDISNPAVKVRHLWDPLSLSDFQLKYGILQTPGIFLISREGIILGRKLDVMALGQLLKIYCKPYEYGSDESAAFYGKVFSAYGPSPVCSDVRKVCDAVAEKTLGRKDTVLFRQMAGDLMYWLGTSRGEGVKCGLEYLIDKYIAGEPAIWTSGEDSLKILSYAEILEDLLGKAPAGKRLPAIEVDGIMKRCGAEKRKRLRLDRLRGTTVIFHSEGCGFCEAELSAADSISSADRKARFFLVDIDEVLDNDPDTGFRLFGDFDLTVIPYITEVDRKGRVTRKYISLVSGQPVLVSGTAGQYDPDGECGN